MEKASILLIDDDHEVLLAMSKFLQRRGYTVAGASNPDAALHYTLDEKHKFDLVVTDLSMPQVDGLAVLRKVHETFPALPVIIISGYGDKERFLEATNLGAFACLQKPLDGQELLGVIERALTGRAQTSSRSDQATESP